MKWIPVSERLPEVGISTLGAFKHCTTGKRIIGELTRVTAEDHTWESDNHEISFDYDVTHWMPRRRTQTMTKLSEEWHDPYGCQDVSTAIDYIAELEAELTQCLDCCKRVGELEMKWIPVSERLPHNISNVMIYCKPDMVGTAWFNGMEWQDCSDGRVLTGVAYWMYLLAPPEDTDND